MINQFYLNLNETRKSQLNFLKQLSQLTLNYDLSKIYTQASIYGCIEYLKMINTFLSNENKLPIMEIKWDLKNVKLILNEEKIIENYEKECLKELFGDEEPIKKKNIEDFHKWIPFVQLTRWLPPRLNPEIYSILYPKHLEKSNESFILTFKDEKVFQFLP